MNPEQVVALMKSRQQRRFRHGIAGKYERLIKKLRIQKKELIPGEKPKTVKTHLTLLVPCFLPPLVVGNQPISALHPAGKYLSL